MFMNTPGTSIRAGALLSDRGIRDTVTLRSDRGIRAGALLSVTGILTEYSSLFLPSWGSAFPGAVMRNAEELLSDEDYSLLTSTL